MQTKLTRILDFLRGLPKKLKCFIIPVICLCIVACFYILISNAERGEVTSTGLIVRKSYLCRQDNGIWVETKEFTTGEHVFICIDATTQEDKYPITIYVFEDGIEQIEDAYCSDSRMVSLENGRIYVDCDFSPGVYLIRVSSIRRDLFDIQVTIIE